MLGSLLVEGLAWTSLPRLVFILILRKCGPFFLFNFFFFFVFFLLDFPSLYAIPRILNSKKWDILSVDDDDDNDNDDNDKDDSDDSNDNRKNKN